MHRKEKINMDAQQILDSEEFKRCADFHGHICPGLSIGYKAAKMAMESLKERRSEDEEIVAVVETDACYADAVQVLTGCTFGKGNFIYKDHGKTVLTLLSRKTGQGVRVAMRANAFSPDETHLSLLRKVMSGDADQDEMSRFQELHFQRSCDVLEMPADELLVVKRVRMELPAKAKIEPSEPCARCGEPTMRTKLETVNGNKVCRECLEQPLC
jgi:formylmethanofuran dehydrogenase subunit E